MVWLALVVSILTVTALAASVRRPQRVADTAALSVRLATALVADREAILAFVPANGCEARLSTRPAASWGTLAARLGLPEQGEGVLGRWRDDGTVLELSSAGGRRLRLRSAEDDVWLLLD
jgi:hypothetical protein